MKPDKTQGLRNNPDDGNLEALRALYPHLSDAELLEAEENLERYLELALRIWERVAKDPAALERLRVLTGPAPDVTIQDERSKSA